MTTKDAVEATKAARKSAGDMEWTITLSHDEAKEMIHLFVSERYGVKLAVADFSKRDKFGGLVIKGSPVDQPMGFGGRPHSK